MNLNIGFEDKEMQTSVYIKMDAHDQLLLSEGVCRQLGILSYHSKVEIWRGGRSCSQDQRRLQLVQSLRLLPIRVR